MLIHICDKSNDLDRLDKYKTMFAEQVDIQRYGKFDILCGYSSKKCNCISMHKISLLSYDMETALIELVEPCDLLLFRKVENMSQSYSPKFPKIIISSEKAFLQRLLLTQLCFVGRFSFRCHSQKEQGRCTGFSRYGLHFTRYVPSIGIPKYILNVYGSRMYPFKRDVKDLWVDDKSSLLYVHKLHLCVRVQATC